MTCDTWLWSATVREKDLWDIVTMWDETRQKKALMPCKTKRCVVWLRSTLAGRPTWSMDYRNSCSKNFWIRKSSFTVITWFERHWMVLSGVVGGDGGGHLQPPLCSAEYLQNPQPTKAWEVLVKILQCALNRTKLVKIYLFRKAFSSFFLTLREAGFPVNARRLRLKENIKCLKRIWNWSFRKKF